MMRTIKTNEGETVLVPEDATEEQVGQMLAAHRAKPTDDPDNHRAEYIGSVIASSLAPIQEALAAIHETIAMKELEIDFDNGTETKVIKEITSAFEKSMQTFGQTAITKQTATVQAMLDSHLKATADIVETQAKSIEQNTQAFNARMQSLEKTIVDSVNKLVSAQTAPRTIKRDKNGDAETLITGQQKKEGLFE